MTMRTWPADHPKAKLLERKRQAILDAARQEFQRAGYETTSMETIAKAAGVSIMTLYRHARSKEALFEEIVSLQCTAVAETDLEDFAGVPLRDALIAFGTKYLEAQLAPDHVALQRMIIAEVGRFPHLGAMVYQHRAGHAVMLLGDWLRERPDARGLYKKNSRDAARRFLGMLAGDLQLRALFGVSLAGTARTLSEYTTGVVDTFLRGLDMTPCEAEPPTIDAVGLN